MTELPACPEEPESHCSSEMNTYETGVYCAAGEHFCSPAVHVLEGQNFRTEISWYSGHFFRRRFVRWNGVKRMEEAQKAVLIALLNTLREQDLVDNSTYDNATRLLHASIDIPEFFWDPAFCQGKGDPVDGYTQDTR